MPRKIDASDLLDARAVARLLHVSRSTLAQLDHVLLPFKMPFGDNGRMRRLYDRGLIDRVVSARTRHADAVAVADAELAASIGGAK